MTPDPTISWADLLRGRYAGYSLVLCLGVALHAINGLITTTTMPSAVDEIGGLAFYSWTMTVYMVASIMSAASGGLVKTSLGARRGFILGGMVFLAGSAISAAAPTMAVMLIGRTLQGAGGGLLLALAYALVRDLFPAQAWSRAFALISGVWGATGLLGPLLGGVFAEFGYWRLSFFSMVPMALVFVTVAWRTLPDTERAAGKLRYPLARLALLGTAIMMAAIAASTRGVPWQAALLTGTLLLILAVLRIDAARPDKILPSGPFSLKTPLGAGLLIIATMTPAAWGFTIYGPLLLQQMHGVPPVATGYFVAIGTFSWTAAAIAVSGLRPSHEPYAIIAGPIITAAGLAGLALFLAPGPLMLVAASEFLSGAGFGTCWAFVAKAIMNSARDGEGDLAASSIATVQMAGFALGSAFVGLIANALGLAEGVTPATAADVAVWVHAAFLPLLAVSVAMAIRLAALTRPGRIPPAE